MKIHSLFLSLALLVSPILAAAKDNSAPSVPAVSTNASVSASASAKASPDESALVEHGHYTNKQGQTVHSPAHSKDGKAPAGASAKCGDGTFSFSKNHRGTCSHHGGVSEWLD